MPFPTPPWASGFREGVGQSPIHSTCTGPWVGTTVILTAQRGRPRQAQGEENTWQQESNRPRAPGTWHSVALGPHASKSNYGKGVQATLGWTLPGAPGKWIQTWSWLPEVPPWELVCWCEGGQGASWS